MKASGKEESNANLARDWPGASPCPDGVCFRVWAEKSNRVEVVVMDVAGKELGSHDLHRDSEGYFVATVPGIKAGARYMYRLDGEKMRPDPASRFQPEGVHGPSQVIDPTFAWSDSDWNGAPLDEMVIYELHVGTFTADGTFEAIIGKLPYLKTLGVTALELMPVADFPGNRNWGYDGVYLYAPARAYGGPDGLKKLVDAAHSHGLAVIQDVVYNHLGPDGNYLRDFSTAYFTSDKKTPWGDALNYANRYVRDFFIGNAMYWIHEYHMDGLRLDATHAIMDDSEEHILAEINRRVCGSVPQDREVILIAEDERNHADLVAPQAQGGVGLDAVWADDFHHEVRVALTGEHEGYYEDFTGSTADLADTLNRGWFYRGQPSRFSKEIRGTDAGHVEPMRFVYCIQNHDQIGNRATGDRLSSSITPEAYSAASALLLFSPATPLLFQGQEWAASSPFLYFTDHNDELGRMVTEGRRAEFAHFEGFRGEEVPDPQAPQTFQASRLLWEEIRQAGHAAMLEFYRELLAARRQLLPPLLRRRHNVKAASLGESALAIRYTAPSNSAATDVLVLVNLQGNFSMDLNAEGITGAPQGQMWNVALATGEWHLNSAQDGVDVREVVNGRIATSAAAALVLTAMLPSLQ